MMLQLIKTTFIAFLLLFVANISHANTCANDLSECTPKDLCEIATVNSNDVFSWSNLRKAKKHVALAKNLGMDCGVTVVTDLCDNDPNKCKINQLCEKATKVVNGNKAWNTSAQGYIDVAKKYNLSCDVETKITEKSCVQEPKNCDDNQLCDMGVMHGAETKTWDTTSKWIKHADEAKMRGLSCGVGVKTKTIVKIDTVDKKSCLKEPKLCNATDLCLIASTSTSTWSQNRFLRHYVIEAKKRGLSCGVDMKTEAKKVETKKIIQKNCSQDAAKCDNEKLCYFSIKFGSNPKEWTLNRYYTKHIAEAKRRGLSCGVGIKTEVKKIDIKKKCSQEPKNCDDNQLCDLAVADHSAETKAWDTTSKWIKHSNEAKKRGLSCGVGVRTSLDINKKLIVKKKCSQNARECNETQLCKMGVVLSSGKKVWNTYVGGVKYSNEAKKRGLSCGVASNNVSGKKYIDIKQLNASEICANATFISNKKTDWKVGKYLKFVKEAKRRGLSCGVGNKAKVKKIDTKKKCSQDAKSCADTKLCSIATVYRSGIKKWNYNHYGVHINEAKKRGLSCGVKPPNTSKKTINKKVIYPKCGVNNKINCYGQLKYTDGSFYFGEIQPKNIRNGLGLLIFPNGNYWVGTWRNNDFLKGEKASAKRAFKYNGFNSLPLADRKNAQQILFNLGYYDSSIDGQFGRKTFIAGAKFLVNQKSHAFFKKTLMSKTGSIETYRSVLNYGKLLSNKRKSNSTNTLFKIETASFNRSDFSRLNTIQRKQLQYGLKQLGFYRSSVDGLYGAGTEKAVRLYARSKGIKSGFPNSIFNKIVSEVNVPSSFTVATKPNPKPKPKSKAASKSGCRSILSILTGIDELCIENSGSTNINKSNKVMSPKKWYDTDTADTDGDGLWNMYENDLDDDGIFNQFDNDNDNDGILDTFDFDKNGDGIID